MAAWIDELAREGLSRSTIAKHVSVASAIYAWASAPSRPVTRNPLRLVELPPNDEKPRLRVAFAPEAAALLAALEPEDRSPTRSPSTPACAARRSTASSGPTSSTATAIATRILVAESKSEAGTQRRPPIADNLRAILATRGSARAGRARARSSSARSCPASSPPAPAEPGKPGRSTSARSARAVW